MTFVVMVVHNRWRVYITL